MEITTAAPSLSITSRPDGRTMRFYRRENRGSRRRFLGIGILVLAARSRTRGHACLPRSRAGARHRRDSAQSAVRHRPRPARDRAHHGRRSRARRCRVDRARSAEPRVRGGRRLLAGKGACAQPDERSRSGQRGAAVDARSRTCGCRSVRSEHGRGNRGGTSVRRGHRKRESRLRRRASGRDQLDGLPRLRERRPRRRRALRGCEERDRARGRRRRRARAR